ncbi:MAG: hypothetical protein NTW38_01185 [Candidatus Aminicenantes bacterium]|nr:hypothetical protein [Candidatus Aminicenantes bacterium]
MEDLMVPEHGNGERTIGFHNGRKSRTSVDFCQAKKTSFPGSSIRAYTSWPRAAKETDFEKDPKAFKVSDLMN